MARHAIGPMILATAILAVPVLAATPNSGADNSAAAANPAATAPATSSPVTAAPHAATTPHTSSGMAATTPADHSSPAAAGATASSTPKFMTSDDQVRVAKIVGASVYNDKDETVGSIDDVLMSHDNKATTAVISVGGFLGMGAKLVSVPFDQLKIENDKIVMPGASKDALKGMPEYKYNNA